MIFVGNDINDFSVMNSIGILICPQNAYFEIKEILKIILKTKGGFGVIRELMKMVLLEGVL